MTPPEWNVYTTRAREVIRKGIEKHGYWLGVSDTLSELLLHFLLNTNRLSFLNSQFYHTFCPNELLIKFHMIPSQNKRKQITKVKSKLSINCDITSYPFYTIETGTNRNLNFSVANKGWYSNMYVVSVNRQIIEMDSIRLLFSCTQNSSNNSYTVNCQQNMFNI